MGGIRSRLDGPLGDDRGSATAEFVLVGVLLALLTLAVLQLGFAVYVRNVVHDAAVEGAYHAALADTSLADGERRTRDIVSRTVGSGYVTAVTARQTASGDLATVEVTVRATLPVVGLLGIPGSLEVTAHAPVESFG